MLVNVLFFGVLKDAFAENEVIEISQGETVSSILRLLESRASNSSPVWNSLAVAVNREYADRSTVLREGDEVALLPPVSGGLEEGGGVRVEITDAPIATAEIVDEIKAGADGAVCVFDGIVRNNTRGRQTMYLFYESYREMALTQMKALADEAVARFGVRDITLIHRLGRLEIGETSVLIAVASAHRGVTFEACRWVIDTLKKTVPIWKKEYFVDGAVWADGEAFPDTIALDREDPQDRPHG